MKLAARRTENLASHAAFQQRRPIPATPLERLMQIRETVLQEAEALQASAAQLTPSAVVAAERTANCVGSIIVTGIGKAGWIGQKLAATLSSTGHPAHFLHPAEAVHGDLGRCRADDLVWALSNSGQSAELLSILPHLSENTSGVIAITAADDNPLALKADCVVTIGRVREACPNGLAPTTSTTSMLAVGDAIAMLASQLRQFSPTDFARFHPGGALGRKLANVDEVMRPLSECRVADRSVSVRQAMSIGGLHGRRSGAVLLTDSNGILAGIFTDSDLVRLLEDRRDTDLDRPIRELMTQDPHCVASGGALQSAIETLARYRISELPVVDRSGRPMGLLDITDLIAEEQEITPEPAMMLKVVGSDAVSDS